MAIFFCAFVHIPKYFCHEPGSKRLWYYWFRICFVGWLVWCAHHIHNFKHFYLIRTPINTYTTSVGLSLRQNELEWTSNTWIDISYIRIYILYDGTLLSKLSKQPYTLTRTIKHQMLLVLIVDKQFNNESLPESPR